MASLTYKTISDPNWRNCDTLQAVCPICGQLVDAQVGKGYAEWAKNESVANSMRSHMIGAHEIYGWEIAQPGIGNVESTYLRYYRLSRVLIQHGGGLFEVVGHDEMRNGIERRRMIINEIEREIALLKEALIYAE